MIIVNFECKTCGASFTGTLESYIGYTGDITEAEIERGPDGEILLDECGRCWETAALRSEGQAECGPSVYDYAPAGSLAYDVDTPEGAAAAHRADLMAWPYVPASEY